ncbi:hypothetical protein D3H65_10635 [Paraflavitalea soli]|uniref:Uncharacterized protein n=1 Tax=Paraflavitalea soli TaxID=2315862 RepID=A0A3B7MIY3_9BACT|nr:hypothetical protein [Paraflavitalea soli]AXY74404.1 hypothetical protein D3H65_10635 [Paraflavitalea soli]
MQVIYTPAAIFCLIAVVLSLLTGSVLLIFSSHVTNNKANRLLGAAFLSFDITLTLQLLLFTLKELAIDLNIPTHQASICHFIINIVLSTDTYEPSFIILHTSPSGCIQCIITGC